VHFEQIQQPQMKGRQNSLRYIIVVGTREIYDRQQKQNNNREGKLLFVSQQLQRIKLITAMLTLRGIFLPAADPLLVGFELSFIVLTGSQ
jgi:hypothetical protein